ncbi:hypothetical protein LQG66_00030 [Bradyrhizobium ontarionense]|uniref:Uncharacterized protein n=1 Tax=Bradyrhizobium ontarionense TaxID=2898149 RepID=A0ABY3RCF1_9BRAD|nr:hypothetical protein [Bradyrhizobium sp. A19]UFZ04757.1 hypothetical protein LQG66_00030 [Bradyrhizobium sp. A19]
MMTLRAAALLGLTMALAPVACHGARADDAKLALIDMTARDLADQGIAIRDLRMRPFPNSCEGAGNPKLSVSNELLQHFRARRFSLESVCLGLSSHIHYDPESGRQLPLANLTGLGHGREMVIPLNLPDCFKNAVPDLECDSKYDTWEHYRLKPRDDPRPFARKFDATVRQYLERTNASGVFHVPDLGQGMFTSSYEWLLASPALPRGYGYALHGPEGDDPEMENLDLSTYRKKADVGSLWSEQR